MYLSLVPSITLPSSALDGCHISTAKLDLFKSSPHFGSTTFSHWSTTLITSRSLNSVPISCLPLAPSSDHSEWWQDVPRMHTSIGHNPFVAIFFIVSWSFHITILHLQCVCKTVSSFGGIACGKGHNPCLVLAVHWDNLVHWASWQAGCTHPTSSH